MKIRKYVALTMPEAMKRIRSELGSDAVILNSRVIKTGGFLGFFKKSSIEVIAAIDPKPLKETALPKVNKHVPAQAPDEGSHAGAIKEPKASEQAPGEANNKALLKEISELKEALKAASNLKSAAVCYPRAFQVAVSVLDSQEIEPNIKTEIMGALLEKWYLGDQTENAADINKWVMEAILNRISPLPYGGLTFEKKFVNVVGPTGVGKTTTLAKMAAECVLKHNKKTAFITTDTYRIAAIDQLKTYARILNIPLEVCYNLDDFKEAADKFKEYDMVLVDTAGRNFRNQQYVEELAKVVDFNEEAETFLVLALTSKQRDMEEIYKQFSHISIDRFIFTKSDETSIYGSMLNMADKYQTGIAYITNGQNVPDDLVKATPESIANTLFGANSNA
ncbi:flagellar biosynthesis protein FlhF [Mesobacillus harenae]|uniref:flagellar biosynthesis protein FlhF n=1 Tax=Mesobacillus harenae TaxID=2213203 RepID=UPI00157FFD58|nr:flagellar biosynthesis protein FlhF [Mesobacillus harenae]